MAANPDRTQALPALTVKVDRNDPTALTSHTVSAGHNLTGVGNIIGSNNTSSAHVVYNIHIAQLNLVTPEAASADAAGASSGWIQSHDVQRRSANEIRVALTLQVVNDHSTEVVHGNVESVLHAEGPALVRSMESHHQDLVQEPENGADETTDDFHSAASSFGSTTAQVAR